VVNAPATFFPGKFQHSNPRPHEVSMPKPNYAFAKRQRELAKKQKKEAKQRERAAEKNPTEATPPDASVTPQTQNNGG